MVQRGLACKTSSEQLWKERGGRQCGHSEKSISSQRDWPIGAGAVRWAGLALCEDLLGQMWLQLLSEGCAPGEKLRSTYAGLGVSSWRR